MKKTAFILTLAALLLTLSACSAQTPASTVEPETQEAGTVIVEAVADTGRLDGERFESVILLEGMEETVRYEHVRSESAGVELDYEYETFQRQSTGTGERFLSLYDDPANPEIYLEVRSDTGNANLVADAITAALSGEYAATAEDLVLDGAGSCIRIDASHLRDGGLAPQMQTVYVIPAADGCRVATAHYTLESAEGFGARMARMVNTITVITRNGEARLTDEQALSAIRSYCLLVNPDLAQIIDAGEYPVYWEIAASDEQQVVVLYRSYTGALLRYYIQRGTGETYVTEFVPGITETEMRTEESLNVWNYIQ